MSTADTTAPDGINVEAVTNWLGSLVELTPPLACVPLHGGYSNLTFLLTDADGRRWVLRRPPLGELLESAHDMRREHHIMSALADTSVPVPEMIGFCDDTTIIGAPFFVMAYVDGVVVRGVDDAGAMLPETRRAAGLSLADVLGDLHTTDVDRIGLGDLARRDGYVERQLRRWSRQVSASSNRVLPSLEETHRELEHRIPAQRTLSLIHGDYRLDNVIVGLDGSVRVVLDWELSTLGDPLADLGMTLAYWTEPNEDDRLPSRGTDLHGFPSRREFASRYGGQTGYDISDLSFYVALAHWKIACIAEGVYARYAAGVMGDVDEDMEMLEQHPVRRAELAWQVLRNGI